MKFIFKSNLPVLFISALFMVLLLSQCVKKKGTEGYTGEIKDPRAQKLVSICHFISEDSINTWVARYRKDSAERKVIENQPAINYLLSNSCSFNSCIIRKIINDENCIGLRVIYGMSADRSIHVILVGIKPDYTTLYIKAPEECCGSGSMMQKALNSPTGLQGNGSGGAEYGQMP